MANYLSLEEAAKKLGVPTEKLVELRSQGQIRGFRDGASWKFPENEIDRLQDELGDALSGGSGILVEDDDLMLSSSIIGGDHALSDDGSDLGIGSESGLLGVSGSDVNLVASEGDGSDVAIVASDTDLLKESSGVDLLEIDSADLQLNDPAILHDSAQLDLAIEPNAGSTGPVTDAELKEISESHPDVLAPESDISLDSVASNDSGILSDVGSLSSSDSGSLLGIGDDEIKLNTDSDLSFSGSEPDDDSGEELIGEDDDDSAMDVIGSDIGTVKSAGASSLELMSDLGLDSEDSAPDVLGGSRGADVLSELDLLSAEQQGSGLISGDSEDLLGSSGVSNSSGLGSSMGVDMLGDSALGDIDDALADDDDLVIADDDDDLVISSAGSDISVAGDSGINLMSPSDSGLSLESEPLDLAGSSISALDLGAELSDGGSSGSGVGGGSGSMVDFQADEEFQLSPSGVGLDADIESGSQVIEVEDSAEAIGEAVEFEDVGAVEADPFGGDVFGDAPGLDADNAFGDAGDGFGGFGDGDEAVAIEDDGEAIALDGSSMASASGAAVSAYEIPFSMLQCVSLMLVLCVMALGGMLMTDLVRNMWTYSETSAPVSALTDSLISLIE
ncbi:Helix-turn-helix domain protein [Rubripirellula amarantea]|uniref:Helix-turn-helix domain protein n=1 Tax=Rubripirellula amarantea TaxID=2527999 RepID=A0A5C5WT66_9BACT|nr:helix-turn-helix domain-containing protein [Rubripirellula amarantea]TWT53263.1 Helix-turn-helix domain protein [Rubripirellula amarantea]